MRASDILLSLEAKAFALRTEDGKLLVSPASRLTADERAAIGQHKAAIIWLLTDRVLGDYRHGDEPVEVVDCLIDLGDGRKTPTLAARWEAFVAWVKEHNERCAELWAVKVKNRKKANAKAGRQRARKEKALDMTAERGGYAM